MGVCEIQSASLTLQRILGGPRYVDDRYRSEEFRWFRDENVVQLAANYARVSSCSPHVLFFMLKISRDTVTNGSIAVAVCCIKQGAVEVLL